jgi:hypothetical protein
MSDKEKILISTIIIVLGAVFSYRVGLVDRILFKHAEQIEELQQKESKKNGNITDSR